MRYYDPIFYADKPFGDYDWGFTGPGWYFWDETEVDANGPYETRDRAVIALHEYARYLEGGHPAAVSAPASEPSEYAREVVKHALSSAEQAYDCWLNDHRDDDSEVKRARQIADHDRDALSAYIAQLETRSPAPASEPTHSARQYCAAGHRGIYFDAWPCPLCVRLNESRAVVEARSPAPASGAPGEEPWDDPNETPDEYLARFITLALGLGGWAQPEKARQAFASLRTRLAAAERAGVALREESSAWADYAAHLEVCRTCSETSWRDCYEGEQLRAVVIPPTAPSPEERANGQ